jgi:hypothetical protein
MMMMMIMMMIIIIIIIVILFPRDIVCLGNICINTLQKGAKDDYDYDDNNDDDDDNNNNNNNIFNCKWAGCRPAAVVIMHVHKYEIRI